MKRFLSAVLCLGFVSSAFGIGDEVDDGKIGGKCPAEMNKMIDEAFPEPKGFNKNAPEERRDKINVDNTHFGFWDCPHCGHKHNSARPNKAGAVLCANPKCGMPIDKKLTDFYPATEEEIAQQQIKAHEEKYAESSFHECAGCGALHSHTVKKCPNCQSLHWIADGVGRDKKKEIYEQDENNFLFDGSHATAKKENQSPQTRREQLLNRRKFLLIAASGAGVAALSGGIYWGLKTTDYPGKISQLSWTHFIHRETYSVTTKSDWESDVRHEYPVMPSNGRGERAGKFNFRNHREVHSDTIQVQEGTKSEDIYETPMVKGPDIPVSNGNGTFSKQPGPDVPGRPVKVGTRQVPNMVDKKIYRTKIDYDTYVWKSSGTEKLSGFNPSSGPLPWPTIHVGAHDRTSREGRYGIEASYARGVATDGLSSESALFSWQIGEEVIVRRNNFGAASIHKGTVAVEK